MGHESKELWRLELRVMAGGREVLTARLHPDFVEFGKSGRVWDRKSVIEVLAHRRSSLPELSSQAIVVVDQQTRLLTYVTSTPQGTRALRSSLWVLEGERWLLRFHQGTPCS